MRTCVYWNESAGEGVSLDEITRLIGRFGHTISQVISHRKDLPHTLESVDCVVAVGGDGTVARIGRAMAGGEVPLAILPVGTANNIATSLKIEGEIEDLIARWSDQRVVRIDVGMVDQAGRQSYFLESAGVGLITRGIQNGNAADLKEDEASAESRLSRARQIFIDALDDLQPRHYSMNIDGTPIEGDYLLIEVLNIASIGPGIQLSAETSPADGLLSVVAAGEADRKAIAAHLDARLSGDSGDARLKSWRATKVELSRPYELHVDDQVQEVEEPVTISIRPGFLPVLA